MPLLNPPSIAIGGAISSGTVGSMLFAGTSSLLQQDNANLFWDDTNNRLGIGTTAPAAPIHAFSAGVGAVFDTAVASAQGSGIIVRKGRGTVSDVRRVNTSDNVGLFNARGAFAADDATTAAYASGNTGRFQFTAAENFTASGQGSYFNLGLMPTGSVTNTDRLWVGKEIPLVDNSATTVLSSTVAASTGVGGIISYTIEVFDGTDVQIETGQAVWSAVNKAGVITASVTEINSQQNLSSGTLTTAWTISAATPAVIQVNANTSLSPSAGYPRLTMHVKNCGRQAIA